MSDHKFVEKIFFLLIFCHKKAHLLWGDDYCNSKVSEKKLEAPLRYVYGKVYRHRAMENGIFNTMHCTSVFHFSKFFQ